MTTDANLHSENFTALLCELVLVMASDDEGGVNDTTMHAFFCSPPDINLPLTPLGVEQGAAGANVPSLQLDIAPDGPSEVQHSEASHLPSRSFMLHERLTSVEDLVSAELGLTGFGVSLGGIKSINAAPSNEERAETLRGCDGDLGADDGSFDASASPDAAEGEEKDDTAEMEASETMACRLDAIVAQSELASERARNGALAVGREDIPARRESPKSAGQGAPLLPAPSAEAHLPLATR